MYGRCFVLMKKYGVRGEGRTEGKMRGTGLRQIESEVWLISSFKPPPNTGTCCFQALVFDGSRYSSETLKPEAGSRLPVGGNKQVACS